MNDLPPPPPSATALDETNAAAQPILQEQADGTLVIDLTRLVPPPPADCASDQPDPFDLEIVVCTESPPSPRLGPMIGPADDGFGSAIPRARIKLSDSASAEANAISKGVGGINANGGEVRLKIGF